MEANVIRDEVEKGENSFGIKSNKFSGALMFVSRDVLKLFKKPYLQNC